MSPYASVRDCVVFAPTMPAVAGVLAPSSLGVSRYCRRLEAALQQLGVDYRLGDRPLADRASHFHVANSSRRSILEALRTDGFLVTLHDVTPRTRALEPLYRTVVYPRVVGRARATIVHSHFAADLLLSLGAQPERLEVIPHPAAPPASSDRARARAALGIDGERLVAVLPGVIKRAKLVDDAVRAATSVRDDWLLVLSGRASDRRVVDAARGTGAIVLETPDDMRYEQAIVAADAVLCLRRESVGESNGPLLDALGAGRAVIATRTGSIPEIAGDAAYYVGSSADEIADGLRALADDAERAERERCAGARALQLTWEASARAHLDLFAGVLDG